MLLPILARRLSEICLFVLLGPAVASAEPGAGTARTAVPLPLLPPLASAAQPWPASMLKPEPGRWYLPSAVVGRDPRRAETAQLPPLRLRPTRDRPPLAGPAGPTLAAPYLAPSGPMAYTPAPDVARLTAPWRPVAADPGRPEPTSDPAWDTARRRLLSAEPPWRQKAAPFLRLAIPNPQEPMTELRLTKSRPDADPPAAVSDPLPKVPLPVEPAEKK